MNRTLVIVPNYNNLKILDKCLFCLTKQDTEDFDILIVDNGSNDDVIDYIYKWGKKDIRHHYIFFDSNCGFAKACNKGFLYSIEKGYRYSILLNNDAFAAKKFVRKLVDSIEDNEKYFAINSLMINYKNPELIDDLGDNYTILGYAYQNKTGLSVEKYAKNVNCFSACGGASIYNNELLEKTGLLDESFFAYLEDVDLSYRAKLKGYKICTCVDAKCFHMGSATSGSKYNKFKVRLSSRNNIYLIYKNMPKIQIIINFLPLFIGTFVKFVFFLFNGFGIDYIKGIIDALKNIKYVDKSFIKKVNPYYFIKIEIELIINTFKYINDLYIRKIKNKK